MGILLGLLTAVSWGGSDFLARFVAQRIGTLRTTLYMQFLGFLLLTISLRWFGGWGHLMDGSGWQPWAWGVLAGTMNAISTLSLYRSFEIGKLAVVAPVSSAYPALTLLLSLLTGERLTPARAVGIALTLLGAIVVARGETSAEKNDAAFEQKRKKTTRAIGWALISTIGFGGLFWLLGNYVVPRVGYASTVWMIRLTSSVLTALVILLTKQAISPPLQGAVRGSLLCMGIFDTGAFIMNNRGMQIEQVSVVSVLASLYGAVTVGLAAIFLHEHLSRWQWVGVVALFVGIYLISR